MYRFDIEHLRHRCQSSGMSYRKLQEITGIPSATINRMMIKDGNPSIKHLLMICSALNISPRRLFKLVP